jgi:deoxyribonuclease-4
MPLFGAHMSAAGGPDQALHAAALFGMETCQLFCKNNKQWKAAPLHEETIKEFARVLKQLELEYTVAHASYLINMATKNDVLWNQSLAAVIDELERADQLGLDAVVVHPGTASDADEEHALQRVSQAVDAAMTALPRLKTKLLFETTAGQGKSIGHGFKQLGTILQRAKKGKKVGICLDTCHVFAAGYALSPISDYQATMKEFDDEIGLDRLTMLHVNDSVKGLGCRVDRHAHLGTGSIGVEGLRNILSDPRLKGLPMILETPKGLSPDGREWDAINLAFLREMAQK